jgi:drug/metabolite transporter (DMT)-like permease
MSRSRLAPALAALLAAMLFGASTPAAKLCLDRLGPLTLAGALYLGAAAVTLPFALRKPFHIRNRRNLVRLTGAVLLGGAVGPVLMLLALARAGAASVSLWLESGHRRAFPGSAHPGKRASRWLDQPGRWLER